MDIFTKFAELGAEQLNVKGYTFYVLSRGSVVDVLLPDESICENNFPSRCHKSPSKFVGSMIATFLAFA